MNYIPNNDESIKYMCESLGINNPEELFSKIPEEVKLKRELNIPKIPSEFELIEHINQIINLNTFNKYSIFLGAGIYDHYIPSVVKHLSNRSEFVTSYTPYQAEISQGILQSIYEYQTYMTRLTGMDVSNASLYDGATALYEAINMSILHTKKKKIIISSLIHPEYKNVVKTYLKFRDTEIIYLKESNFTTNISELENISLEDVACVIMPQINFLGHIEDIEKTKQLLGDTQALFITTTYPTSLGILKKPGNIGADIVVAEGQCLGLPQYFGGLTLGIIACKTKFLRLMPGRIVGQTEDKDGNKGFVLTMQAREQHIRRARASSNICSNQAWCALTASIYLSTLGENGFKNVALKNLENAQYFASKLDKINGLNIDTKKNFFNEFVLTLDKSKDIEEIDKELRKNNIIIGLKLKNYFKHLNNSWLVCVTETKSKSLLDKTSSIIEKILT